ncbi:TIGR03085 family metal-binding protein [Calidifontibacter terrae]
MSSFAQSERAGLVATMREVGPDAPTLCGDWKVRDLAAHLILRERRPDAALGIMLAPLAGRTEKVQEAFAQHPFDELLETIGSGPPKWSPFAFGRIDEAANLGEYFIHHEDILRAADPGARRTLDKDLSSALFALLPRMAKLTLREARTGVVADCGSIGRRSLKSPKDGHGNVVLLGEPQEVLLYAYGRGAVTDVELDGADHDVEELRQTPLGG